VYVTAAPRSGAEPSVVFVDERAGILDRVPLHVIRSAEHSSAAFRGIVYALWRARRLGYRRVAVYADDPAAVAQISGERCVDPDAVGPYLQIRALMHIYRQASVHVGELIVDGDLAGRPSSGGLSVAATRP
jgi:hypothetical protein